MRIILTLDLLDTDLAAAGLDLSDHTEVVRDLQETLQARLDEVFPGHDGYAVPQNVRVGVGSEAAVQTLLDAAGVGLDGAPEDVPAADEAFAVLQTLQGE